MVKALGLELAGLEFNANLRLSIVTIINHFYICTAPGGVPRTYMSSIANFHRRQPFDSELTRKFQRMSTVISRSFESDFFMYS